MTWNCSAVGKARSQWTFREDCGEAGCLPSWRKIAWTSYLSHQFCIRCMISCHCNTLAFMIMSTLSLIPCLLSTYCESCVRHFSHKTMSLSLPHNELDCLCKIKSFWTQVSWRSHPSLENVLLVATAADSDHMRSWAHQLSHIFPTSWGPHAAWSETVIVVQLVCKSIVGLLRTSTCSQLLQKKIVG